MSEVASESKSAHEGGPEWRWPIDWGQADRLPALQGRGADALLALPELGLHRVLDQLSAQARALCSGMPGTAERLSDSLRILRHAAPWLQQGPSTAGAEVKVDCVAPASDISLIDDEGAATLLAVAARVAGADGARLIAELTVTARAAERWFDGSAAAPSPDGAQPTCLAQELTTRDAAWRHLNALAHERRLRNLTRCTELLESLKAEAEVLRPAAPEPVTWTTGITRVDVADPCSDSPVATLSGIGFGAPRPGVGLVAPSWDGAAGAAIHRPVPVLAWSDSTITVQLGSEHVSGVIAFADLEFVSAHDTWIREQSRQIARAMRLNGCPGFDGAQPPLLWDPFSATPPATPAAALRTGRPRLTAHLASGPDGLAAPAWAPGTSQLQAREPFWVVWDLVNAPSARLRPLDEASAQVLAAAGHASDGIDAPHGRIALTAPASPVVLGFVLEADNGACSASLPLRAVVTGPALGPLRMTVLQSLPGGDVGIEIDGDAEVLKPEQPGGLSIPLVAEKRTVVRIDWWPAFAQVPPGEEMRAVARLELHSHGTASGGVLRPGDHTAEEAPVESVILFSGPAFASLAAYDAWQADGNDPASFNVAIPAHWCQGGTQLTATVTAFSDSRVFTATATRWVTFHRRHRVRIRYRRHSLEQIPAPTVEEALASIRHAAAVLPMPDPEIVALDNDPVQQNGHLLEDLFAERGGAPTAAWRDEIWLVVGPRGANGAYLSQYPWIAATETRPMITAHEIGHAFGQRHIALCGAAQDPEDPAAFPHRGELPVVGWDVWHNQPVRHALDFMTYCDPSWATPERWRRMFLSNRP